MIMKELMEQKKERILTEAERLFAHFGIKKTTMDDIAQKAGMGKSTMYYYFKSKEDIFAEVIRRDSTIFKLELNQAVSRGKTPQEQISNYVLARMKHLSALHNYYSTLTDEYLEQYAFVEKIREEFIRYEISTLSTILEDGVKQGIFNMDDIEITARNFAICLKGLEYPFFTQKTESDMEKESMQMLQILFKGIETR